MKLLYFGESHMEGMGVVIQGFPGGVPINEDEINVLLARRQGGYGRGDRMKMEKDRVQILSGILGGKTLGSPITLFIANKDNRRETWDYNKKQTIPRPGHADLSGSIKYGFDDMRLVTERASARNTASLVLAGGLFIQFLKGFDIDIIGMVESIGGIQAEIPDNPFACCDSIISSPLRTADGIAEEKMIELIKNTKEEGDTLGGTVITIARGVPVGLGSYCHPDERLDSALAGAFMAIPSVKGVEIGLGFELAHSRGSQSHDIIRKKQNQTQNQNQQNREENRVYNKRSDYYRETNRAGGIEGGVSNGEDIVVRVGAKPIPTLGNPLPSVDLLTGEETTAPYVRSDVCVLPALSVIAESVMATVITRFFLLRYGGDTYSEILKRYK